MHRLSSGRVSVDSSVVVDFYLTNNLDILLAVFASRIVVSDFVEKELAEANIMLPDAEVVPLSTEEEWQFFNEVHKAKPGLGLGEIGALTVARSRSATVITNDRQARLAAEDLQIPVSGAIGVLECAVETGSLSGKAAVRILEDMIREGAWISKELVEMFRQKVLEQE